MVTGKSHKSKEHWGAVDELIICMKKCLDYDLANNRVPRMRVSVALIRRGTIRNDKNSRRDPLHACRQR
jgi:hypothetical protein